MAKESEERRLMKSILLAKGDAVSFPIEKYLKITRIVQHMNQVERVNGMITRDEVVYSVQRKNAPDNEFFVIRN